MNFFKKSQLLVILSIKSLKTLSSEDFRLTAEKLLAKIYSGQNEIVCSSNVHTAGW